MSMVETAPRFQDSKIFGLFDDMRHGNIWLWRTVVAMAIGSVLMLALQFVDARLINGVSVWDKPAKFFFSLVVQYGTVSWAFNLLPFTDRKMRGLRIAVGIMLFSGWMEMAYIIFRAAQGEGSHFNTGTRFAAIAYGVMGVGAVSLTATAAYVGWNIWRRRDENIWREAAGFGLVMGALLGTITAGYMSSMPSHWVGGNHTDANGLVFFNWSTTGGDLRVAHFLGLHAAQFIPLSAMSGDRRIVYASGLAMILLTSAIFILGVSGVPILIP